MTVAAAVVKLHEFSKMVTAACSMVLVMGIYGSKLKACGDEFRNQHAIAVAAAEYETKVVAILVRNNNGDKVSLESMRTLHGSYHASRIHVVERS
ncbi:hypothetical protein Tco_0744741, partial [Tanacetum coccineum]